MAVVSFMSDFGDKDHYVAAVKATILSENSTQIIVDISHHINRHDIGHAAYVLKQVYDSFPKGTVHLIAVDPVQRDAMSLVALSMNGHLFVSRDSGVFSLLGNHRPEEIVELNSEPSTFPERDTLAKAAVKLANGASLGSLGHPKQELVHRVDRQLRATKREIVGQVVHIDHYGNLITNINQQDFNNISKILGGSPAYTVRFAREQFNRLHTDYRDVDSGDCFVLFNAYGFLQIGINKGRASDLLGLRLDAPIQIEFNS